MSEPLLSIKNLKVSFDTYAGEVEAVRGVSLELNSGETLAIVGESGCGKSVTAQTILRLHPESNTRIKEGEILLDGHDIVHAHEKEMEAIRGETVGMVFQDPMTSLNPTMLVGRQVGEVIRQHERVSRKESESRSVDILDAVRIPNAEKRAKQYPGQFSGGMRQRAMIGLSIACIPKLLIADEPTTALDVTIQAQILDLMKSIQKEENMAIILITHDLGVAASIAGQVAVMYAGKIVEQGTAEEIFKNPRHPYTWGLMQSIPKCDQKKDEDLYVIQGTPPKLIDPPKGCAFAQRCQYCMRICKTQEPPETILEDGHRCSCWLLDERAPKVKPERKGGDTVGE